MMKEGVNQTDLPHCRDLVCTDADKYLCCDETPTCEFFWCGEGKEWVDDYATLHCEGRQCLQSNQKDIDTCCKDVEETTSLGPGETTTDVSRNSFEDETTTTTLLTAGDSKTTYVENGARRMAASELAVLLMGAFLTITPTTVYGLRE